MKSNQSPCIHVCDFSGPNGWCKGCGRTKKECFDWKKMSIYNKKKLKKKLDKRLQQL